MSAAKHNAAILPLLERITDAAPTEAEQWVLLESLCLGIGFIHGHDERATAEFIETMAERIASGERS